MSEPTETPQVINFTCPFCNKECLEGERIIIDMEKWQMCHEVCLINDRDKNGSIDNNSVQGQSEPTENNS